MSGDGLQVLVMSGSSRTGSYNLRLAAVAAEMARSAGAEVILRTASASGMILRSRTKVPNTRTNDP